MKPFELNGPEPCLGPVAEGSQQLSDQGVIYRNQKNFLLQVLEWSSHCAVSHFLDSCDNLFLVSWNSQSTVTWPGR